MKRFKALIRDRTGKSFPQDAKQQLWGAIGAVFGSWMNDRAMVYRRKYGIPHDWGTAVNVRTNGLWRNMGRAARPAWRSRATRRAGEGFLRRISDRLGEDVVAGVRTPHPIADLAKEMPAAHEGLMKVRTPLEEGISKTCRTLKFHGGG